MKKKHPLTIRTPENINKEYTDRVITVGNLEVELSMLQKRQTKLIKEQEIQMGHIIELSKEMDEAQNELQRQAEAAIKAKSEQQAAQQVNAETSAQVQAGAI